MKTALLLLLFIQSVNAFYVTQEYGGITFAKYSYNGYPVFNDIAKNKIITDGSTSSKTITNADFISILPSTDEIALTTSVFTCKVVGNSFWGDIERKEVMDLLTSKSELMFKMFEESEHIQNFTTAKDLLGIDIVLEQAHCKNINECKSKLEFMRRQFLKLP